MKTITIKISEDRNKEVAQVIREIDESKMKDCRKISARKDDERAGRLYDNMWAQFDLLFTEEEMKANAVSDEEKKFGMCVGDYAITKEALDAFYTHPYNKAAVKSIKKHVGGFSWGMFLLNMEPMIVNDDLTFHREIE
jgi:hypothetical protein